MAHCCSDDGPCLAPLRPDILQADHQDGARHPNRRVANAVHEATTGHVVGLNDGAIFPASHFHRAPSKAKLMSAAADRTPLRGPIRVLIALVSFSDVKMTQTKEHFNELFFSHKSPNLPHGSVTEYYEEASGGDISITGEVYDNITVSQTMAYYVNNESGQSRTGPNVMDLAKDTFDAIKDRVGDFAPYDNDKNTYVDAFIVVHAGKAAEEQPKDERPKYLWSLKWQLRAVESVNGTNVYGFLTIPEEARIGVCCHEIGHLVFGWPDFYDAKPTPTTPGIGSWCLMSGGTWGGSPQGTQPCHPSAWCKASQGWVDVTVQKGDRWIRLPDVKDGKTLQRLWTQGDPYSKEYFLLENREQKGYDESLPGSGLLVWHIDETVPDNTNENHRFCDLMQADGRKDLNIVGLWNYGDTGDPFPGSGNNRSFANSTTPNSKSYADEYTRVSIYDISDPGPVMTMQVNVL